MNTPRHGGEKVKKMEKPTPPVGGKQDEGTTLVTRLAAMATAIAAHLGMEVPEVKKFMDGLVTVTGLSGSPLLRAMLPQIGAEVVETFGPKNEVLAEVVERLLESLCSRAEIVAAQGKMNPEQFLDLEKKIKEAGEAGRRSLAAAREKVSPIAQAVGRIQAWFAGLLTSTEKRQQLFSALQERAERRETDRRHVQEILKGPGAIRSALEGLREWRKSRSQKEEGSK